MNLYHMAYKKKATSSLISLKRTRRPIHCQGQRAQLKMKKIARDNTVPDLVTSGTMCACVLMMESFFSHPHPVHNVAYQKSQTLGLTALRIFANFFCRGDGP